MQSRAAGADGPSYSAVSVANIFGTLDANGDGAITASEFRQGYVRYRAMRLALGVRQPATTS